MITLEEIQNENKGIEIEKKKNQQWAAKPL